MTGPRIDEPTDRRYFRAKCVSCDRLIEQRKVIVWRWPDNRTRRHPLLFHRCAECAQNLHYRRRVAAYEKQGGRVGTVH